MEFDWISIMLLAATLGFWGFVTVGRLSHQKKEKESPTNSARSASEPNDTPKQANDLAEQPFAAQSEDSVSEAVQAKQAQSVRDPSPNRNNAGTVVGVLALLIIGVIVYLLYTGILQEMIKNAVAFILAIMLLLLFGSTSSEDQSKKKASPENPPILRRSG